MWVDLSQGDGDAGPLTYSPSRWHCVITPAPPTAFDENKVTHEVRGRYHAQISTNTRLTFVDRNSVTHWLYVRGVQDERLMNQRIVLLCEEVVTPQ